MRRGICCGTWGRRFEAGRCSSGATASHLARMPHLHQALQRDRKGGLLLQRLQAEGQVPARTISADSYTTNEEEQWKRN